MNMFKQAVLAMAGSCLILSGPLAGTGTAAQPKSVRAIAGTVGGTWFIGFGAMGKVLTNAFPGLEFNLLAGGSVGNPLRLSAGDAELSITQLCNSIAAQKPADPYKKKIANLRSLGVLGDITRLNIVVRDDLPIRTLDDLARLKLPLRLAHGPMGTTSYSYGKWVLEAYGIGFDDIKSWGGKLFSNNYDDVANMVKDNQVDMFFWTGPGEAGFIQDAALGTKLRWIPVSGEKLAELHEKYGLSSSPHPGTMYNGLLGQDVPAVADTTELLVRDDMDEEEAYLLLKAMFAGWEEVVMAYPHWASFKPETAWKGVGFPLHPGAERFYREAGGMK